MENIIDDNNIIRNLIISEKIVDEVDLEMAEEYLEYSNKTLIEILNDLGFCDEIELLNLINKTLGLNIEVEGDMNKILSIYDDNKIKEFDFNITPEISEKRNQLVINYNDDEIIVLTSSLDDEVSRSETSLHFRKFCSKSIRFIATTHYNLILLRKKMYENINYKQYMKGVLNQENYADKLDEALKYLIEHASIENASDIFIQYNDNLELSNIFFRTKRSKTSKYVFPTDKIEKFLSYIFQKSNMQAGKINGHQDGSLPVKILNDKYEVSLRLNSISTISGKQLTIRLQEKIMNLNSIGFQKDDLSYIQEVLKGLKGIILMVGATGSGKTTTMYAMLNEFNPFRYNFITLEDPVEIRKFGINQVQINDDAGQSFKDSIRACMRQAPDGILVGEIRDNETAERAIEAANTGHLVFATIHANGVETIQDRLEQLGVENASGFVEALTCSIYQELRNKDGEYFLGYEMAKGDDFENITKYRLD